MTRINDRSVKTLKRFIAITIAVMIITAMLSSCRKNPVVSSIEELNSDQYSIGVGIGEAGEAKVKKYLPNAKVVEFADTFSGYIAVAQGKLDAYAFDRIQLELAIDQGQEGIKLLDGTVGEDTEIAVGISPKTKVPDLKDKLNAFIAESRDSGLLDQMYTDWQINNKDQLPDIEKPTDPDFKLVVGTTGIVPPYSYYKGTELCGYDIELALRFAKYINADLEFKVFDYSSIITAAETGEVDCIMANLNKTPERMQEIDFSDCLCLMQTGVVVRDEDPEAAGSSSFADKFVKTFITEDRYVLFLQGIEVTLLMTVLAIIFGTVLGFVLYLWYRKGGRLADAVTSFFSWLIGGMPIVVLLMILYYVVFGDSTIDGMWVAVIAFTLIFGSGMFDMLKSGVNAVDKGQTEASYSLGLNDRQTFFGIILPQAARHFMPSYKAAIVALIKATAVVGYISVQDLTKVSDIVRSRTFEALFPLITVAIVYFILAAILTAIVSLITANVEPRKRSVKKILKGVRRDDRDITPS